MKYGSYSSSIYDELCYFDGEIIEITPSIPKNNPNALNITYIVAQEFIPHLPKIPFLGYIPIKVDISYEKNDSNNLDTQLRIINGYEAYLPSYILNNGESLNGVKIANSSYYIGSGGGSPLDISKNVDTWCVPTLFDFVPIMLIVILTLGTMLKIITMKPFIKYILGVKK